MGPSSPSAQQTLTEAKIAANISLDWWNMAVKQDQSPKARNKIQIQDPNTVGSNPGFAIFDTSSMGGAFWSDKNVSHSYFEYYKDARMQGCKDAWMHVA